MNIAHNSSSSDGLSNIAQYAENICNLSVGDMNKNCRFSIAIPCYYGELKIRNTLEKYKQFMNEQEPNFEVILLLNGPSEQSIDESSAKNQIQEFISANPKFPLQVYTITIPFQVKGKIGRLRGILAKINADRCLAAGVPTNNFVHITHDADLVDIDKKYLSSIEKYFTNNPNTQIIGGHVEYPEWFKGKYYLGFILQRIEDAFGIVGGYRNKTSVKSGNAIYRLDNLISHPFRDAKKGEATTVVNATRKKFEHLGIGLKGIVSHANKHSIPPIISDPRRIVLSIQNNQADNFSRRHASFAQEGDHMFNYNSIITDSGVISDGIVYDNKVTINQLEEGISGILIGRLVHIHRSTSLSDDKKMEYVERMKRDIQKAVFLSCGLKISIDDDNNVHITDMEQLQSKILEKFGPLSYIRN